MRILKIIDSFITNSSTNSTTILLAVRRNMDLYSLLDRIKDSKDYPNEFFDFVRDQSEIDEFERIQEVEVRFLLKEYDLFINTISHYGSEENEIKDDYERIEKLKDEGERIERIFEFVKEIEKNPKSDLIVIFGGDIAHDGMRDLSILRGD